jgi:MFS family permease
MRVSDDVSLPSSPRSYASDISMPLITDSSIISDAATQNRYRLHPLGLTYKRCLLAMAFIGLFADYYLLTVIIPFLPSILSKSYSTFVVGALFASKPFVQIFANIMFPRAVTRYGSLRCCFASLIGLAFSTAAFAVAVVMFDQASYSSDSYSSFKPLLLGCMFAARTIQGAASALLMISCLDWISKVVPLQERGSSVGFALTGVAVGAFAGPPIGGYTCCFSYSVSLLLPFGVAVVMIFLCLVLLAVCFGIECKISPLPAADHGSNRCSVTSSDDFSPHKSSQGRFSAGWAINRDASRASTPDSSARDSPSVMSVHTAWDTTDGNSTVASVTTTSSSDLLLYKSKPSIILAVLIFIGNSIIGMLEPLYPIWLLNQGYSVGQGGLMFSSSTVGFVSGTWFAGYLCDRLGKFHWICISGLVIMVMGLLGLYLLPPLYSFWSIFPLFTLGLGFACINSSSVLIFTDIAQASYFFCITQTSHASLDLSLRLLVTVFAKSHVSLQRLSITNSGLAFGIQDMSTNAGMAVGAIVGTVIVAAIDFPMLSLLFGCVAFVAVPIAYLIFQSHYKPVRMIHFPR